MVEAVTANTNWKNQDEYFLASKLCRKNSPQPMKEFDGIPYANAQPKAKQHMAEIPRK